MNKLAKIFTMGVTIFAICSLILCAKKTYAVEYKNYMGNWKPDTFKIKINTTNGVTEQYLNKYGASFGYTDTKPGVFEYFEIKFKDQYNSQIRSDNVKDAFVFSYTIRTNNGDETQCPDRYQDIYDNNNPVIKCQISTNRMGTLQTNGVTPDDNYYYTTYYIELQGGYGDVSENTFRIPVNIDYDPNTVVSWYIGDLTKITRRNNDSDFLEYIYQNTSNLFEIQMNLEEISQKMSDGDENAKEINQQLKDADSKQNENKTNADSEANKSSEDVKNATNTPINIIKGFIESVKNTAATDCNINLKFGDKFDAGNQDFCKLEIPNEIKALSSIILIGFYVPVAIWQVRKIISLIGEFQ